MHIFFQCKSWNSSWSWNKLPLKNPLSFKNIRHLTLSMSDCLTSNSLRAGSFGGFGGGKWGTFSPPPPFQPPQRACSQATLATRHKIHFAFVRSETVELTKNHPDNMVPKVAKVFRRKRKTTSKLL